MFTTSLIYVLNKIFLSLQITIQKRTRAFVPVEIKKIFLVSKTGKIL